MEEIEAKKNKCFFLMVFAVQISDFQSKKTNKRKRKETKPQLS